MAFRKINRLGFLLFFAFCDDFAALVVTTFWAYRMGKPHFTALAALHQIGGG